MTTPRPAHTYTGMVGQVANLLVDLEAEHHQLSWDQSSPVLHRISRDTTGMLLVAKGRLGISGHHPRLEMHAFASSLDKMADGEFQIFPEPPVAHALVFEAWGLAVENRAEANELSGRSLADIPGSTESRLGHAVIGRRLISLVRPRRDGAQPAFHEGFQVEAGGMVDSLQIIHQGMLQRWRAKPVPSD